MAQNLVEAHEGRVWVESRTGRGQHSGSRYRSSRTPVEQNPPALIRKALYLTITELHMSLCRSSKTLHSQPSSESRQANHGHGLVGAVYKRGGREKGEIPAANRGEAAIIER